MLNSVFLNKTEDLAAELYSRLGACITSAGLDPDEEPGSLRDDAFDLIDELIIRLEPLTDRRETP